MHGIFRISSFFLNFKQTFDIDLQSFINNV
jgi:hypothetical protein